MESVWILRKESLPMCTVGNAVKVFVDRTVLQHIKPSGVRNLKSASNVARFINFQEKETRVRCLSVPELQGQSPSKSPMLYSASEEEFGNLVDPNMNEEDRGLLEEMIEAKAAEKELEEVEDYPRSCAV